ncbi:MAG: BamA/TamA family outer membrane protein [Bacteroidaceae bacterium]|nr:BamA/TamA family outer membrane protein [Bacteroidaceae bacterium]
MIKKSILYILLAVMLAACSTTRHIPEGEQLYTGIKSMNFINEDKFTDSETGRLAVEEITAALDYPPNGSLAGSSSLRTFSVGLWFYNTFHDSKKGIGRWLFDKFGTTPVLISKVNPELRAEVATDILKYYGYFNGRVETEILTDRKNSKKANVVYNIHFNEPYRYDSVNYTRFPEAVDSLIDSTRKAALIKAGTQFNAAAMEEERTRISTLLRENGYYYFQPGYLNYLADTINTPGKVNLRIQAVKNIPENAYTRYRIGKINMRVTDSGSSAGAMTRQKGDTLKLQTINYIYYGKKPPVRVGALMRNIQIRKGEIYSQEKQQRATYMLNQMNIFSNVNFSMTPGKECDTLDVNITAQLDKPYDFTFELNATTKSNSQIGPGSKITLAKKNVFRGGETLKLSLTGSYEWQTDKKVKGRAAVINSWEMGADVSLTFPRLFLPGIDRRHLRVPATTSLRIYTDQMNRSGFFKMIHAGGDATYRIYSSGTSTHTVIPFRLTYDMLLKTTAKFDSIAASNRAIENSFRDQFIPATQYTYTYDESNTRHTNKTWLEVSVTSAGNITSLVYLALGQPLNKKDKHILKNPYAQFLKATAEIRELWKIDKDNYIATRLMLGAIHSYGNSLYAPYSEQFYIGGANSLRAFTVRSVGPGSYRPASDDRYSYLDETGTFKLEMNVEYRFRVIADLHGAVFVDAGNVWLLKKDPERPGGELRLKNFGDQIALNTGVGARYDLGFLVLRVDFGLGLHAPYKTRRSGYFNLNPIKDGFAWHFGIGYPF